jgi:mRNA interferase MazF
VVTTQTQRASFRPTIDIRGAETLLLVDQMAAVDLSRLGDSVGQVDTDEGAEIEQALRLVLDL